MKSVYITVRLDLADEADADEVVQEMDYKFEYGNDILSHEITDIVSNTDTEKRWIKGNGQN